RPAAASPGMSDRSLAGTPTSTIQHVAAAANTTSPVGATVCAPAVATVNPARYDSRPESVSATTVPPGLLFSGSGGPEYRYPRTRLTAMIQVIGEGRPSVAASASTAAPAATTAAARGSRSPRAIGRWEPLIRSSVMSVTPLKR